MWCTVLSGTCVVQWTITSFAATHEYSPLRSTCQFMYQFVTHIIAMATSYLSRKHDKIPSHIFESQLSCILRSWSCRERFLCVSTVSDAESHGENMQYENVSNNHYYHIKPLNSLTSIEHYSLYWLPGMRLRT